MPSLVRHHPDSEASELARLEALNEIALLLLRGDAGERHLNGSSYPRKRNATKALTPVQRVRMATAVLERTVR